jgi:hypothetical protein
MDVLYVIGGDSPELRYSLRSLKNLEHDRVFTSGMEPDWVRGTTWFCFDQSLSDQENSNRNLLHAAEHLEDFIFMNDDFFVLTPTSPPEAHQGSLDAKIVSYAKTVPLQAYSLQKTRDALLQMGHINLKSYELHLPMVMNGPKLVEAVERSGLKLHELRPRTLYGNIYIRTSTEMADVKSDTWLGGDFLSTDLDTPAGAKIRELFPDPSPYER